MLFFMITSQFIISENNDIVIPIVVLEELDKFKRGNDQINFHAREFVRELDQIAGQDFFVKGASLGKGMGRLFIQPGVPFSDEMKTSFSDDIPDHRILAVAEYLSKKKEGEKVILVTKDMNLRMKAKSLGVQAEDYKTDQVKNLDTFLNKSVVTIEDFSPELIAKLYENNEGIPVATFFPGQEIKGNRYYILKNGSNSVLACYDPVKPGSS